MGAIVVGVAIFGPLLAPNSPTELAGIPWSRPGGQFLLGTDFLGRDVLSRVLWGGRSILTLAIAATTLAYVMGGAIGLVAGYTRSRLDPLLMRTIDVLLAFPPLLFLLLLVAGAGSSKFTLLIGIAVLNVPSIARVVRTLTLENSVRGYVEAAEARGEPTRAVLFREVLPNITGPIMADAGPRLTGSILLVAGLTFLGLGLSPPDADWALMISENRDGLGIQPFAVLVPAALIACLTVAVNLTADAVARSMGRSMDAHLIRR